MDIVIYGAGGIALGACEALREFIPGRKVVCFLVTSRENNKLRLSGIPIVELKTFAAHMDGEEKENIEILIATPEDVMAEIEERLDGCGLLRHSRLTSRRWSALMGYYYTKNGRFQSLEAMPVSCRLPQVHMFMAKHYLDRPLEGSYEMPGWVSAIQVGAEAAERRIAEYSDADGGEHISAKNKNYSELTALYWIWKHVLTDHGYYGLCHYRRILDLSEDDLMRLEGGQVDAVLPYPMPYEPDIEEHHKRYLKEADWRAVLQAVSELCPDDCLKFREILQQKYFYNYNIMLVRGEVLKQYCRWLFPILKRVEELSAPKGEDRSDRYIGYAGETLATFYFMANRDRFNIKHAGCIFLV